MNNEIIQDCELHILNLPLNLITTNNKYAVDFKIKNIGNVPSKFVLKFQYQDLKCEISQKPEFTLDVNEEKDFSIKVQPQKSGLKILSIRVIGLLRKLIKTYVEVPNPEININPGQQVTDTIMGTNQLNSQISIQNTQQIQQTIKKEIIKEELVENLILIKNIYFNVIDPNTAPKEISTFINIGGDANPVGENIKSHLISVLFYNPELLEKDEGEYLQFLRELFFNYKKLRKEPFYYLTFPVDQQYSNEDFNIISSAFNFFIKNQIPKDIDYFYLLNFGIISSFDDKPHIIFATDHKNVGHIKKIIEKIDVEFKNKVNFIIDDDVFSSGILYEDLVKLINNLNIIPINVIITSDLIENRPLLSKFIDYFK